MSTHSLIINAHSSTRYTVAALLGTIEVDSRLLDLDVQAPLKISKSLVKETLGKGEVILAYSVMSTQLPHITTEIRDIRDAFGKNIRLVAGGPHASARPESLLELGFDYVIVGEGEESFPDLLHAIMEDKNIEKLSGVVTTHTIDIPKPKDLPQVILDNHPPFALGMNIVGPIEVTRGCPFRCKFCATPFLTGGRVRHRSIDSIVYWLERAVKESGFERTWFLSPNALSYGSRGRKCNRKHLERLLRKVTSITGLDELFFGSFPSEVRPEFVDPQLLKMLRGYVANETLQIGLQSGSNKVLEITNRHHTVEEGMHAIRTALDSDFIPHIDMIFGLPGERKEDVDASLDLCETLIEMGAKLHGHVFMPLPGSAFENMPAGRLDKRTRRILGEFSRKKVMTGSWSHQETLSKELESDQC